MTFGASFYNSSGFLQISEGNKNLQVVQTGTLTIPRNKYYLTLDPVTGRYADGFIYVNGLSMAPLVFVKFESADSWLSVEFITPNVIGIRIYGPWAAAPEIWSIPYMLAVPINSATPTGWGIKIIGNDGTVSFGTDLKYVRVFSSITLNTAAYNPQPAPWFGYSNYYDTPPMATGYYNSNFITPWICINGIGNYFGWNTWTDNSDPFGNYQTFNWNDLIVMGVRSNGAGVLQSNGVVNTPGGHNGGSGGDLTYGAFNTFSPTMLGNYPPYILAI